MEDDGSAVGEREDDEEEEEEVGFAVSKTVELEWTAGVTSGWTAGVSVDDDTSKTKVQSIHNSCESVITQDIDHIVPVY